MRRKHTPQRTCIACRQVQGKRQLVRIVRTPEGAVQVDETGKRSGRGAYLCHRVACWEKALRGKQLEHALKTTIAPDDLARLEQYAATLAEEEAAGGVDESTSGAAAK